MKRIALLLGCLGIAAGASAQVLPSGPVMIGAGRVVLGGDVAVSVAPEDPGFFNYSDYEHSTLGGRGAVYAEPIWVHNSNSRQGALVEDNDTAMIGLAGRLRVRPTVYLVGEVIPRVAGYNPGVTHGTFGLEKRTGGHTFQLNFSNGFGTTMGQLARGGLTNDDWYLGFHISRKFF